MIRAFDLHPDGTVSHTCPLQLLPGQRGRYSIDSEGIHASAGMNQLLRHFRNTR